MIAFFALYTLAAIVLSCFFFGIPGALALRLLKGAGPRLEPASLLVAPALGAATLGPFSLGACYLFGFTLPVLFASWLVFLLVLVLAGRKSDDSLAKPFCPLAWREAALLLCGAALSATFVVSMLVPFVHSYRTADAPEVEKKALFIGVMVSDHSKAAIVDTIAREGLPPAAPDYSRGGGPVALNYYYLWHFLAAETKLLLPGITGWESDTALTWFTAFSTVAFLSALAARLSGRAAAGAAVALLSLAGRSYEPLLRVLGPGFRTLLDKPVPHGVDTLLMQATWAPQHVYSACALLVFLFAGARLLAGREGVGPLSLVAGLALAASFGASVFVSLSFALILPLVGIALVFLRPGREGLLRLLKALLPIAAVAALFSLPVLLSELSGGAPGGGRFPVGVWNQPASLLVEHTLGTDPWAPEVRYASAFGWLANILLYWIQRLPLHLGIAFPLGLAALWERRHGDPEERALRALSATAVVGMLLVSQFLRSVITTNDLGWRAALVPILFLLVWAAVAWAQALGPRPEAVAWREGSILLRFRRVFSVFALVGIGLGIGGALLWADVPYRRPDGLSSAQWDIHRRFLRQEEAWQVVRAHTGPRDVVLSDYVPWQGLGFRPCNLPYALFSDRRHAFSHPHKAQNYTNTERPERREAAWRLVLQAFSGESSAGIIRRVRNELGVRAILLDRADPVWRTTAIEDSGEYALVYGDADFKVYAAVRGD
ncbi:MAG: hypothetical protein V1918_06200 [Planctomycetota bacterium]